MTNKFPEQPKGVQVQHFNDSIQIKINWFDAYDNSIIFCIIIVLICFIGLSFALFKSIIQGGESEIIKVLFLILCVLFESFMIYMIVVITINETFITINDKAIIVRSKPIPSNDRLDLRLIKLENIFSKVESKTYRKNPNSNEEETIYYYKLYAQTYNNTTKEIIETGNKEQMLFIEKTLKDYLNIKDNTQEGKN